MHSATSQKAQQPESSQPSFPLLSTPDSWLHSFLSSADADTRLALLQTCQALKTRLLRTQRVLLDVDIDATSLQVVELKRQQVILQQASDVKLQGQTTPLGRTRRRFDIVDGDQPLSRLLMRHMALLGGPLRNITSVYLEDCRLSEVVPSSLVVACPNMKQLELNCCMVGEDLLGEEAPPLPVCPQLTELILKTDEELRVPALARATRVLPNITALDIDADYDEAVWEALLPLTGQLSRLTVDSVELGILRQFMHLTHVCLEYTTLDDSLMEVLLSLPQLTHVTVSNIKLGTSFQQHACIWEHLLVEWRASCTIASLAYLPVSGIQKFELSALELTDADTHAVVADAINNTASCGHWQVSGGGLRVQDNTGNQELLCMAALPLLQRIRGCRCLTFINLKAISTGFVGLLAQNIPLDCESVTFQCCSWAKGSWEALHSSLPRYVKRIKTASQYGRVEDVI